jgi:hypothetical protein
MVIFPQWESIPETEPIHIMVYTQPSERVADNSDIVMVIMLRQYLIICTDLCEDFELIV